MGRSVDMVVEVLEEGIQAVGAVGIKDQAQSISGQG